MSAFGWLDYSFFILYLVASVAVGLLFVKEQHTMKDFFLAGRSMGSVIVAISVLAALFSGISYIGGPAEVYQNGLAFAFILFSFFIATPFTTLYLMPFFYRSRFITAYHYLEERFSLPVRLVASGLFILRVTIWLGIATYAPALALQQATGLPLQTTILLTGVLTTLYTMMGGMKAVIWTDVMQFVVLFAGQLAIVIVAIKHIPGGLGEVFTVAQTHGQPVPAMTLDLTQRVTWPGMILAGAVLSLVQMATDQVSVQRYMTARDLGTARRALWLKLLVTIPVLGLFYGTGAVLRAFYNHAPDPLATGAITKADQILPYFVVHELPHGLPGVLLAAIFAASMSTVSAGLNSLSSATMVDFQQRLSKNPLPADTRQILQARLWTLLYGVLVIAVALVVGRFGNNLVEATNIIIGIVGGPLLGLFVIGVFIPRIGAGAALIGGLVGFIIALAIGGLSFKVDAAGAKLLDVILPMLNGGAAKTVAAAASISFMWLTTLGAGTALLVAWLLSYVWKGRPAAELRGLVWDSSMYGNEEVRDRPDPS